MKKSKITRPVDHRFATLSAAAGALNVPLHVLRAAKKSGASGFAKNGNVDLPQLTRWLLTKGRHFKPGESLEDSRARLATIRAKHLERSLAAEDTTNVPVLFAVGCFERSLDWLLQAEPLAVASHNQGLQGVAVHDQTEIRRQLDQYHATIRQQIEQARTRFSASLSAGPKGDYNTPMAEFNRQIRELGVAFKRKRAELLDMAPESSRPAVAAWLEQVVAALTASKK